MPNIAPTLQLLFFADFPPSNLAGGAILMSRLLSQYPQNSLRVLTGSSYMRQSNANSLLSCQHYIFPSNNQTGRWGVGRIKGLLNYMSAPVLLIYALFLIHRHSIKAILSVAHGYFFIVAAVTSKITKIPLVIAVHDDWFMMLKSGRIFPWALYYQIYRLTIRSAKHIYAISPAMVDMLKNEFNVAAELQMPAVKPCLNINKEKRQIKQNNFSLLFAGSIGGFNIDAIELLMDVVAGNAHNKRPEKDYRFDIYSRLSRQTKIRLATGLRNCDNIKIHDWVSQDQLLHAFRNADMLFLPLSFNKNYQAMVATSFPTKTADYLSVFKPIIVLAPPYSTLMQYAKKSGFAAAIDQFSAKFLVEAMERITNEHGYAELLIENAKRVFAVNHDLDVQYCAFKKCLLKLNPDEKT